MNTLHFIIHSFIHSFIHSTPSQDVEHLCRAVKCSSAFFLSIQNSQVHSSTTSSKSIGSCTCFSFCGSALSAQAASADAVRRILLTPTHHTAFIYFSSSEASSNILSFIHIIRSGSGTRKPCRSTSHVTGLPRGLCTFCPCCSCHSCRDYGSFTSMASKGCSISSGGASAVHQCHGCP